MFDIVLVHPQIPPNAGNAIRLAANTGARLHLVEPLGFSLDDKQLKRAGLDYHEMASVRVHRDWQACRAALSGRRLFAFTARASRLYTGMNYRKDDSFVFGTEATGLASDVLDDFEDQARLRLPMRPGNRSLNLSNAVAVVVFEAWRQLGFAGGA